MMFSVGQRLRQARLDQGLDFETLVARTKIQEKFLKAIEADDRKVFPSGFFYKSFVAQYARALSVDTREIDQAIQQTLSAEAPLPLPGEGDAPLPVRGVPPLASRPRIGWMRSVTSVGTLVVVLVGCSGFYVWWRKLQTPMPSAIPAKTGAAAKTAPAGEIAEAAAIESPPQPSPVTGASEPAALAESASSQTPATPPPSAVAQSASGILLELVARERTWLAVSSDGLMIFKGTLSPHESKTVEGKQFAKLRVNNPAAIEVKLNGKHLGPLGPPGQFLVVVFTRDKFHVLDSSKDSD